MRSKERERERSQWKFSWKKRQISRIDVTVREKTRRQRSELCTVILLRVGLERNVNISSAIWQSLLMVFRERRERERKRKKKFLD